MASGRTLARRWSSWCTVALCLRQRHAGSAHVWAKFLDRGGHESTGGYHDGVGSAYAVATGRVWDPLSIQDVRRRIISAGVAFVGERSSVFGNNYVKFGILHCITLVNLIFMYIDEPMWIIFSVFCIVLLHNNFRGNFSSNIPKPFGFILGLNSAYSSIDHFPLIPWILYPSLGIVIARSSDSFLFANSTLFPQFLQTLGKHSLDIYMIHWVVLYLVFCILYPGVRHLNIN